MRYRRSWMRWLCATVAPWALGAGLLVSFTAVAGNDPLSGFGVGAIMPANATIPDALVPLSTALAASSLKLPRLGLGTLVGQPPENGVDEEALRPDMKAGAIGAPAVERARKGDPLARYRPSLSRRASDLGLGAAPAAARRIFGHEPDLPPAPLAPLDGWALDPELGAGVRALRPGPDDDARGQFGAIAGCRRGAARLVRRADRAVRRTARRRPSPAPRRCRRQPRPPPTRPRSRSPRRRCRGCPSRTRSTRSVRRIRSTGRATPTFSIPTRSAASGRCLAEAVYFEARSESAEGQAAVAQVVLNRVRSGLYPASVCGVVYQNRHRHLACQFTFACEGKSLRIADAESWETAKRVAREVTRRHDLSRRGRRRDPLPRRLRPARIGRGA